MTKNWILMAFISMFFAGLTSVIAKFGLSGISANLGMTIRTIAVSIIVIFNFLIWSDHHEIKQLNKQNIIFLAISGFTTAMSWIFYYKAIKIGEVSKVALIDKGSIVITLLLSFTFLHEPFSFKTIMGAILIVSGLIVLMYK